MPLSHDVTLPIDQPPEWPEFCIHCGAHAPDANFTFRAGRVGASQFITPLGFALGSRPKVSAPACTACLKPLRRERWLRLLADWVVVIPVAVAVILGLHFLGWLPKPPNRKFVVAAIVIVALIPYFLWDLLRPRTIDATAIGRNLDYEFRDRTYAEMFGELNDKPVK